ncbi:MAG: addiction module protein [Thiohalocapsa sp. PB-PSB1]|jgi:putative addiction module component (TIGR02574 family)|nr:MAG: addiction module protein [Thiohalocapsa sp. PB-PSB1]HCS91630.1 addiction module protein [Chromatiaceae bacterium]
MTPSLEKIEREVLDLPETERAFLADRLLSSLDGEILGEVDAAWVAEAERRYAEYKDGKRTPIPASCVLSEADRFIE